MVVYRLKSTVPHCTCVLLWMKISGKSGFLFFSPSANRCSKLEQLLCYCSICARSVGGIYSYDFFDFIYFFFTLVITKQNKALGLKLNDALNDKKKHKYATKIWCSVYTVIVGIWAIVVYIPVKWAEYHSLIYYPAMINNAIIMSHLFLTLLLSSSCTLIIPLREQMALT